MHLLMSAKRYQPGSCSGWRQLLTLIALAAISLQVAINPATETSCYPLVISAIVPRPIGFLSTISADGTRPNLSPFSYFSAVSHDPPMVCVGICRHSARGPGCAPKSQKQFYIIFSNCLQHRGDDRREERQLG